jgi:soluble lytic murein transglycosylase-like protein
LKGFAVAMIVIAMPAVASSAAPQPGPAGSRMIERWQSFIAEASQRFGVPEPWIAAVMKAESGGRTMLDGRPITSSAGAMGLMQLMPATWAAMRVQYYLGPDPQDPRDNILAGTAYLRAMYDRFGYPGLFAAYNAGPARFARHLRTGAPLPGETRAYIAVLAKTPAAPAMPTAMLSGTRLFFAIGTVRKPSADSTAPSPAEPPKPSSSAGLFVPLGVAPDPGR